MSEKIKTYGQTAYETYSAHTGGKSLVSGDPLPSWDQLPPAIREAWNAAGSAVDDAIRGEMS